MYLLIVTGYSGAGKSHALKKLEDSGFFCVDNLPILMLQELVRSLKRTGGFDKVAVGIDSRNTSLENFDQEIEICRSMDVFVKILFLEASDEVLLRRYNETRREHPLARGGKIEDGIREEHKKLDSIYQQADYYINTSGYKPAELSAALENIGIAEKSQFMLSILSFGFKNGLPIGAEMVMDVRFLPNPFWIEGLREKTGLDQSIKDYVLSFPQTQTFLDQFSNMVNYLIPYYQQEGKNQLQIAIGCTGGCHRSVCIAEELRKRFAAEERLITIQHRDIPIKI